MAVLNLRDSGISTSSQDEVTILNQSIVDLTAIVEQLPITDLSDVTIASVVNGDLLVYNGGTGEWENSSALFPDSLRMKQYEMPNWVQFGNYNLDDSVPLSVNANSIAYSAWRRSTSSVGRTVAMNGVFYDYQNTSGSAWENIGPGYAWGVADQQSIYYAGNVDVRTEPGVVTDVSGNMDTFETRMDWRVYAKQTPGSATMTGYNIMTLRKDNAQFNGKLICTGNLQIDGSQVDFTNLPTSDPLVAGRLWNDSGTVKISAG